MDMTNEQIVGHFDDMNEAQACRQELLDKFGKNRPWFYVYGSGEIVVANEFGGRMIDEKLFNEMKSFVISWKERDIGLVDIGPKEECEEVYLSPESIVFAPGFSDLKN